MFNHINALTPSELKSAIIRHPLIVKPDMTVMDAIAQMSGVRTLCETATTVAGQLDELYLEARSSCVLVVEDEKLIGILTERDVVRLSAQQLPLENLVIRKVMIHPVITLYESDFTNLFSTVNLIQQHRIRHLPILDKQDQVVGLVTNESLRQSSRPVDLLRLRLVSEVMTSEVICDSPNSSMLAIAQLMAKHRVSSIMIVEPGDNQAQALQIPVGILTERDILQFQALGLNLKTCLAEAVMSTPIFAVKPEDSLWVVQQIMEQRLIRRLAVTGKQGELLGIVTQTSLLQALNPLEIFKLAEVLEKKVVRLEAEKIEILETCTIELEQQIEARTLILLAKAEREKLVTDIATQIRSSLSLQTILDTTVAEVRQLLGCDRVNIWQFDANWQAIAVAESTEASRSLVGECINENCFKEEYTEIYRQGRIRVVCDIYKAKISDCHRDMLIRLQTRAKMLVPLYCGDQLWGLLNVSESQHPRDWEPEEVELLQVLSVHLAVALQQATTHQKLQEQLIDRQQAEALLQESEQRYITLTSNAPVGIFRTDANGQCIYVNDHWCLIAGISPENAFGDGWRQGLHPEDIDKITAEWYQSAQECRPFQLEYRFQRPHDGKVAWVYGKSVVEKNASGNVIGYVGTITDITDRKRIQLTLERLVEGTAAVTGDDFFAALVRHIAEALNVPYVIVTELLDDKLHALSFWANGALQLPISYHPAFTPCECTLRNGEFYCKNQVQELFPHDLDLVKMQASSYLGIALKDERGNAIGNLCILDVQPFREPQYTEAIAILHVFAARAAAELQRKAANNAIYRLNHDLEKRVEQRTQELQAREAQLRDLFDNATDLIQSVAADGQILFVNRAWKQTLGYDDADLEQLSIFQIIHPDELVNFQATMQSLFAGSNCFSRETRFLTKDGKELIVEGNLNCQLQDGIPIATRGIFRDITQRKQADETIRLQVKRESLLREITQKIRQSLDLPTIFDTACHEIRQVLQADRVGIFKFYPESNFDDGEFVAESVLKGFPSVLAIALHDHCFGENYSSLYARGRFSATDDIYNSGNQICHTDILAQFQVRANLIMPLLCGDDLWGLLCVHQCAATRHWQQPEIDLTQQLSNQLAIAIQQANLYEQIQSELLVRQQAEANIVVQLRRQQTLGAIIQKIRESLDINEILATVTKQVKDVLHCDRAIVFRLFSNGRSQIVEETVSNNFPSVKDQHWENEVWSQEILDCYWQGKPRIVSDVMNDIWTHCLVEYSLKGQIQSKIVAPILQEVRGSEKHRWVAQGATQKIWGVLVVHACQEKRVWKDSEAQLLQQIANQLAIAIQQASLFEQLQQELTERQEAEAKLTDSNQQLAISNQELARATRLKDEFLANMSHELRTPLNAILGMTEGLQDQVFGNINTKQLKALETIERSGSHLLELINDILDVAKIEAGQIELDSTKISVAYLCESSLVFIKQQALQKRIQLQIKLPLNLPELLVDERRIRQVLINLLNNALKFTPEKGRITLEVIQLPPEISTIDSTEQYFLQFAVSDTGIGISSENINKLFQPFVQIDSSLNRQYAGTGLGLALVKRIVELHGGRVGLTSELAIGSRFTIDLPCRPSSTLVWEMIAGEKPTITPKLDSQITEETTNLAPLILLAEDNEANISTVSGYLEAKGYRIVLANNGQEAIDCAKTHHPDLILMDIQMPGMDGLEAMKQIRLDPKLVDIPIVTLTALAMAGDRDRCLAAGANDYLSKPVKLKQLVITIQQLLVEAE